MSGFSRFYKKGFFLFSKKNKIICVKGQLSVAQMNPKFHPNNKFLMLDEILDAFESFQKSFEKRRKSC